LAVKTLSSAFGKITKTSTHGYSRAFVGRLDKDGK